MSDDLDARRNRAARARSELTQTDASFSKLREAAIEKWLSTAAADTATREECYRIVKTLDVVRQDLFASVEDGRMVEAIAERTQR